MVQRFKTVFFNLAHKSIYQHNFFHILSPGLPVPFLFQPSKECFSILEETAFFVTVSRNSRSPKYPLSLFSVHLYPQSTHPKNTDFQFIVFLLFLQVSLPRTGDSNSAILKSTNFFIHVTPRLWNCPIYEQDKHMPSSRIGQLSCPVWHYMTSFIMQPLKIDYHQSFSRLYKT